MTEEVARHEPAAQASVPSDDQSPSADPTAAGGRSVPAVPAPPPDDENPALIDARKAFIVTIVGAALFIGAVVLFIL